MYSLYHCLKDLKKTFKFETHKKMTFSGYWDELQENICLHRQSRITFMKECQEKKQLEHNQDTLIPHFV